MMKIARANYSLSCSRCEAEGVGKADTQMDKGSEMFETDDTKCGKETLRC